ncbi:iron-containing alcohol dehydrogenase [Roseateles sp. DC23W]|uniref:Iron-containing alcohol dehydrogenase n=1 Tax=Pelomonas dachongensis TaxID=3299029 RepID=A0ABW7ELJ7_9BURK
MAQILYLTRIEIEFGASRLLPAECERAGMRRPLVVTDAGVRAAGVLDKALAAFAAPPAVFDRTPSNPTEAAVRLAVDQLRAQGCDGLIAIGGGSSIDLAKGVAIAATHEGPLKRWATIEGGAVDISSKVLPVIAVPTTAGTGSEVARGAILIVDDGRKLGFHNWELLPKTAICDPDLTLALPAHLTAATGMDAVAHCIETFLAPAFNPPADGIALEGLRRGWQSIERATRDGQDRQARLDMMCASVHGALAFQKGLGAVHSLSHSLGGINPRLHHGTLNAVFLPAVIRFNAEADSVKREQRMARLAHAMGLAGNDADAVANAIAAMNARLGLPAGLAAMGAGPELDEPIVEHALRDHCHKTNPRIASADDYRALLAASR